MHSHTHTLAHTHTLTHSHTHTTKPLHMISLAQGLSDPKAKRTKANAHTRSEELHRLSLKEQLHEYFRHDAAKNKRFHTFLAHIHIDTHAHTDTHTHTHTHTHGTGGDEQELQEFKDVYQRFQPFLPKCAYDLCCVLFHTITDKHTHVHIRTHSYTHIHTHTYIPTHTYVHTYIRTHIHTYTHTHTQPNLHVL